MLPNTSYMYDIYGVKLWIWLLYPAPLHSWLHIYTNKHVPFLIRLWQYSCSFCRSFKIHWGYIRSPFVYIYIYICSKRNVNEVVYTQVVCTVVLSSLLHYTYVLNITCLHSRSSCSLASCQLVNVITCKWPWILIVSTCEGRKQEPVL